MSPIPDFNGKYYLPAGQHICTLEEIEEVFLFTDTRTSKWNLFRNLLYRLESLALKPTELLIDGSFVTKRNEPGDVDICALIPPDRVRAAQLLAGDPHDQQAINVLMTSSSNPTSQSIVRDLFGAHLLVARNRSEFAYWSKQFKRIKDTDPDPRRDPPGIIKPQSKGILHVIL